MKNMVYIQSGGPTSVINTSLYGAIKEAKKHPDLIGHIYGSQHGVEGLLYDFGQLTLPFDNVDKEYLQKPRKFDLKGLKHFMLFMGPLSSIFDLIVFAALWFIFKLRDPALFQTIWFTYSIVSNLLGMHIIRTAKIPFVQSHANKMVYFSSILLILVGIAVPFTWLGNIIGLVPIPLTYMTVILGVPILYCFVALFAKKIYIKKYGEWI